MSKADPVMRRKTKATRVPTEPNKKLNITTKLYKKVLFSMKGKTNLGRSPPAKVGL